MALLSLLFFLLCSKDKRRILSFFDSLCFWLSSFLSVFAAIGRQIGWEFFFRSLILFDCRPGWTLGWFLLLRKSSGRLLVFLLLFHLLLFLLLYYRGEKDRFLESVSSKWWDEQKKKRTLWGEIEIEWERDVPVFFFLSEKGAREKSVHFPCLSPLCPVLVSLFHLDKLIPRFSILDSAVFFFFYFVIFVAEMCRDEKRVDHSHFLNSLSEDFPSLPFPSPSFLGHCLELPLAATTFFSPLFLSPDRN